MNFIKKALIISVLLSFTSFSSVTLAFDQTAKEETTPPEAEGALTLEQMQPIMDTSASQRQQSGSAQQQASGPVAPSASIESSLPPAPAPPSPPQPSAPPAALPPAPDSSTAPNINPVPEQEASPPVAAPQPIQQPIQQTPQ